MSAVADPTSYRTVLDLSMEVRRSTVMIRRDLLLGRIRAQKPGGEWLFDQQQWESAVAYYRQRQQARERRGRERDDQT